MLTPNNLYLGDCLDLMPQIPDKSVDMILCDLPYGTTACKWDVIIPFDKLWEQYERITKDNGAIVLFGSQPFTSLLINSNVKLFKYCWYWEKNRCGNFMAAKYKPLKFMEEIAVFGFGAVNTKGGKGGGKTSRPFMNYFPQGVNNEERVIKRDKELPVDGINIYNKLSNKEFTSNGSNYPKDKIIFPTVSNDERIHPTQKPLAICEYLIKTYTNENDLILDNCIGSGTTCLAAKNLNRRFIGIEKEEKYFNIAKQRVFGSS